MMTEKDIKDILEETNIPVFRGHAPIGTRVPYMVYHVSFDNNLGADDITYVKIPQFTVELYNITPSLETREMIENKLTENGIYYTSDEADDEEQSLFITYYYFGGLSNGRE